MTGLLPILCLLALASLASAALGVWFITIPEISRKAITLSGAILATIALFWVLPELAAIYGWAMGATLLLGSAAAIAGIDRFVYPICPACSHSHDHDHCHTRLHGFAPPLIIAALLHSLFDGWAFAIGWAQNGAQGLAAGIAVHKIFEGLALGVILRAAISRRSTALIWAVITQMVTIAGGALAMQTASLVGSQWISLLLAVGGGMFLYLGGHAIHSEWKRRIAHRSVQTSS